MGLKGPVEFNNLIAQWYSRLDEMENRHSEYALYFIYSRAVENILSGKAYAYPRY